MPTDNQVAPLVSLSRLCFAIFVTLAADVRQRWDVPPIKDPAFLSLMFFCRLVFEGLQNMRTSLKLPHISLTSGLTEELTWVP